MTTRPAPRGGARSAALEELHQCYAELAASGKHLLQDLLGDHAPVQWQHYPADDAFDVSGMYQWFYHSHSPEDRPGLVEHGHVHLFARTEALGDEVSCAREREFLAQFGASPSTGTTRHLICIALTSKGVPCSLFTVNSWVTGDQMLSSRATLRLLRNMRLDTGHSVIDRVIASSLRIYSSDLSMLLRQRDENLLAHRGRSGNVFARESLEILSSRTVVL